MCKSIRYIEFCTNKDCKNTTLIHETHESRCLAYQKWLFGKDRDAKVSRGLARLAKPLPTGLEWDVQRCYPWQTSVKMVVEGVRSCEECTQVQLEMMGKLPEVGDLPFEHEYDPDTLQTDAGRSASEQQGRQENRDERSYHNTTGGYDGCGRRAWGFD